MKSQSTRQPANRPYRADLRAKQALSTREQIIDAALALVERGDREVGYTAIAREAAVSVPTVYRHFPTRKDLFEAIYLRREIDTGSQAVIDDDAREQLIRDLFRRLDDARDPAARAGRLDIMWEFRRATTVPKRRAAFETLVAARLPNLGEPHRTWLIDLAVVLVSSMTAESLRGYLDLDGDASADRVLFALDALFAQAATLLPEPT